MAKTGMLDISETKLTAAACWSGRDCLSTQRDVYYELVTVTIFSL